MANTKKSLNSQGGKSTQPSGKAVVPHSTRIDSDSFEKLAAVKCMSLLVQSCTTGLGMSKMALDTAEEDARKMAKMMGIEDSDKIFDVIMEKVIKPVRSQGIAGALDRSGFW